MRKIVLLLIFVFVTFISCENNNGKEKKSFSYVHSKHSKVLADQEELILNKISNIENSFYSDKDEKKTRCFYYCSEDDRFTNGFNYLLPGEKTVSVKTSIYEDNITEFEYIYKNENHFQTSFKNHEIYINNRLRGVLVDHQGKLTVKDKKIDHIFFINRPLKKDDICQLKKINRKFLLYIDGFSAVKYLNELNNIESLTYLVLHHIKTEDMNLLSKLQCPYIYYKAFCLNADELIPFKNLKNLRNLTLFIENGMLSKDNIELINTFKNLNTLKIIVTSDKRKDESYSLSILNLPELRRLGLHKVAYDLSFLRKYNKLNALTISGIGVSINNIDFNQLESLNICKLNDCTLDDLNWKKTTSLEAVDLNGSTISDSFINMERVKFLNLYKTELPAGFLNSLQQNEELQMLDISETKNAPEILSKIQSPKLSMLKIPKEDFKGKVISRLNNLKLNYLNLFDYWAPSTYISPVSIKEFLNEFNKIKDIKNKAFFYSLFSEIKAKSDYGTTFQKIQEISADILIRINENRLSDDLGWHDKLNLATKQLVHVDLFNSKINGRETLYFYNPVAFRKLYKLLFLKPDEKLMNIKVIDLYNKILKADVRKFIDEFLPYLIDPDNLKVFSDLYIKKLEKSDYLNFYTVTFEFYEINKKIKNKIHNRNPIIDGIFVRRYVDGTLPVLFNILEDFLKQYDMEYYLKLKNHTVYKQYNINGLKR